MKARVLDSGRKSALENMEEDFLLLKNLARAKEPILRFYEWTSLSATHGYFMDPFRFLNAESAKRHHLQIARRPTGGGLLFHLKDFTFSLFIPSTHPEYIDNVKESYRLINEIVLKAVENTFHVHPSLVFDKADSPSPRGGFCMANPTVFDLMLGGKKIGGAAQRRTKEGLLHQGSINLGVLNESLLNDLLQAHPSIVEDILRNSCPLIENAYQTEEETFEMRKMLKFNFTKLLN